jgi:hypothetical protein
VLSGAAELIYGNLARRREALQDHRPEALTDTARALQAMRDTAAGHVPELRADRRARLRRHQLAGEKGLPLEDLVAIGHESELGRQVALSALRYLMSVFESPDGDPGCPLDAMAGSLEAHTKLAAGVLRDYKGGSLEPSDSMRAFALANELAAQVDRLLRAVAVLAAQPKPKPGADVALYRPARRA